MRTRIFEVIRPEKIVVIFIFVVLFYSTLYNFSKFKKKKVDQSAPNHEYVMNSVINAKSLQYRSIVNEMLIILTKVI